MKNELTWRCDMCGDTQYDRDIGVLTYALKNTLGGFRNLKYCKVNQHSDGRTSRDCYKAALLKSKTGKI